MTTRPSPSRLRSQQMAAVETDVQEPVDIVLARAAACALAVFAGVMHILYAPGHFAEGSEVGFFFLIVGVDLTVAGFLLWALPSPWLMLIMLGGAAGVVLMYLLSRTTGLPFGPVAGEVEPMGRLDGLTALAEGVLLLLLSYLIGARRCRD